MTGMYGLTVDRYEGLGVTRAQGPIVRGGGQCNRDINGKLVKSAFLGVA
jgi:FAD/FMN-containing dehydrogenase